MAAPLDAVVTAPRLITAAGELTNGWVAIAGDRIAAVGSGVPPAAADVASGGTGSVLVPGFVDVHCHGGGGADLLGTPTSEATEAASGRPASATAAALGAHRRAGTTTTVASLVTASFEDLEQQLHTLAPLVQAGELAGTHLEGPWLSPQRRGAHDPQHLATPDPAQAARLLAAADGTLRMVTLAPELPGAPELITLLTDAGVTVAVGHTDASYEQTAAAIDAGARWATHLGNAMAPLHHRSPGPALALLEDERVTVELIADGHHLHPSVVRTVLQLASGRAVLVSDAMAAAAAADGSYTLGGLPVTVTDGVARLPDDTLAGSTLTLAEAVRQAVQAGVPLPAAVRAASSVPAQRLGLDAVGDLAAGCWADLVLLDEALQVAGVWRHGRRVDVT
ncbi:MAG: N-acetylglucosamine-6-phosphate deacetylase [Actinomycetales bacterium]